VRYNGICIAPVVTSTNQQRLKKIIIKDTRDKDVWEDLGEVSFVPLISEYD
jgi:hypothetical protein